MYSLLSYAYKIEPYPEFKNECLLEDYKFEYQMNITVDLIKLLL